MKSQALPSLIGLRSERVQMLLTVMQIIEGEDLGQDISGDVFDKRILKYLSMFKSNG